MMYGYGYGPGTDGLGFWMIGMWLFGIVLFAALVVFIVWAVRRSAGGHAAGPGAHVPHAQDSAMMLARERLAKGDITPEEFDTISRG